MRLKVQKKSIDGHWDTWSIEHSYGAVMECFRLMRSLGYVCRFRRI